MSFVSSLPANLPKYGVLTKDLSKQDFAKGYEQYVRIVYSPDYAVGADRHTQTLLSADFAVSLETFVAPLLQLDRAFALERLRRSTAMYDLLKATETFLVRLLDTDIGAGKELGFAPLTPKYLDLETGKVTTTPTSRSVYIGTGGIGGCVGVDYVVLCYKKLGDILDWETLWYLLIAFKYIDDRARAWIDIVNRKLPKIINEIIFELP